jgi:hypothetical protein
MYSNNRADYRLTYIEAWQKYQKQLPLTGLETQLVEIILLHPEYQPFLQKNNFITQEFYTEENPFMHMSLHLAIREQLVTNRPNGIREVYNSLKMKLENELAAEHAMMDCLAAMLQKAQQTGAMPNEMEYLKALQQILVR